MSKVKLWQILLEIDSIIIGERFKGGVFRPCQETIPSSTIEGALRHCFGLENIPAVGLFKKGTYQIKEYTYSVRDRFLNTSRLLLITNYLAPAEPEGKIQAEVYIPYNKDKDLKDKLLNAEFEMGALKSKGFGRCKVKDVKCGDFEIKQGILNVKIFLDEAKDFNIEDISPLYGYLFKPDSSLIHGAYKKSLFPGSLVEAPEVFLKEVTYYDRENG
ncbi:hypothetical protein BBF96_11845 [Anoxybacter fermentans]|uniref:Uncharacterized protein n=1 Tax=Anoxybacter fermentans TaxID=1323375 RepID=A0A3S9T0J5_9FIRM|nr:hypothetical protein [Anoxybacter fermentans]AZR74025.1 hypothetical protein BBF96_11845 [Anoxybacter fermentans]